MQQLEFVVMDFEDREQVDCLILSVFDFEDAKYIALAPEDEEDSVYIFEYIATGEMDGEAEEFEILDIEDDALYDRIVEHFNNLPILGAEEEE